MKKYMRLLSLLLCAAILMTSVFVFTGCEEEAAPEDAASTGYQKNTDLDTSKEITLRIAGSMETWPQMDSVIAKFEKIYPNCTVVFEYVEEFSKNLPQRLTQEERKIDIFNTVNIQEDSPYHEYALNLISDEAKQKLDLSGTNPGIVDNFKYVALENTQYAIPYGGEMRGMYVNKTLLAKYGLEVPKNRAELLHCCEVLYAEGYVPLQSDVGSFAQQLLYPYICNSIVNGGKYEEMYSAIENLEPGISEYFRDAYTFLYELVEKGYFDYKRVENETPYTFNSTDGKVKDFLNIIAVSDDEYEKKDDVGGIAFMTATQAFGPILAKTKEDYHSEIEYEFILSPVGENGGCAYLSPSDGLAINKNSDNIDWALEFLNFFFTPENAREFAKESGKVPITLDGLLEYDVPAERTCTVGQVTFSYQFYKTVTTLLGAGYDDDMVGISKMNAQKYMKDNGDGTYSILYTLEDYLTRLETEFQKIKEAR